MILGRTTTSINKAEDARTAHGTNQFHRCVAASLSNDGVQVSRMWWLDLRGDRVRLKFSNI